MSPLLAPLSPVRNHAGQAFPATEDMNMQMINFLTSYTSGIDNSPEAVPATLSLASRGISIIISPNKSRCLFSTSAREGICSLGITIKCYRGCRMNVVKRQNAIVLIHFLARNFSPRTILQNKHCSMISLSFATPFRLCQKVPPDAGVRQARRPGSDRGGPAAPGNGTTSRPFHP